MRIPRTASLTATEPRLPPTTMITGLSEEKCRNEEEELSKESLLDSITRLYENRDAYIDTMKNSPQREYMKLKENIFEALYKKNSRWYDVITITYILGKPFLTTLTSTSTFLRFRIFLSYDSFIL